MMSLGKEGLGRKNTDLNLRYRPDSVICGRLGLLGIAAENVQSHNEFLRTEGLAINNPGSCFQLTHDRFHVHMRAKFPGALRCQLHSMKTLILHGS